MGAHKSACAHGAEFVFLQHGAQLGQRIIKRAVAKGHHSGGQCAAAVQLLLIVGQHFVGQLAGIGGACRHHKIAGAKGVGLGVGGGQRDVDLAAGGVKALGQLVCHRACGQSRVAGGAEVKGINMVDLHDDFSFSVGSKILWRALFAKGARLIARLMYK